MLRFFHRTPKLRETPQSKLNRAFHEWYAHNTGLDEHYTVREMYEKGILIMPVMELTTHPNEHGEE